MSLELGKRQTVIRLDSVFVRALKQLVDFSFLAWSTVTSHVGDLKTAALARHYGKNLTFLFFFLIVLVSLYIVCRFHSNQF